MNHLASIFNTLLLISFRHEQSQLDINAINPNAFSRRALFSVSRLNLLSPL